MTAVTRNGAALAKAGVSLGNGKKVSGFRFVDLPGFSR